MYSIEYAKKTETIEIRNKCTEMRPSRVPRFLPSRQSWNNEQNNTDYVPWLWGGGFQFDYLDYCGIQTQSEDDDTVSHQGFSDQYLYVTDDEYSPESSVSTQREQESHESPGCTSAQESDKV